MLIRYAVRDLVDGKWAYRSARDSDTFGPWEGAQLWENPKIAAKEAKRHREPYLEWRKPRPACTTVTVDIGEPE